MNSTLTGADGGEEEEVDRGKALRLRGGGRRGSGRDIGNCPDEEDKLSIKEEDLTDDDLSLSS